MFSTFFLLVVHILHYNQDGLFIYKQLFERGGIISLVYPHLGRMICRGDGRRRTAGPLGRRTTFLRSGLPVLLLS
jgi:hypothetical protein